MDKQDWDETYDSYYSTAISARDKLIQIQYFYRVTSVTVQNGRKEHPLMSKVSGSQRGSSTQNFELPYGQNILGLDYRIYFAELSIPNISNPKWLILRVFGYIGCAQKTFLGLLLFYARKTIELHWISTESFDIIDQKRLANTASPSEEQHQTRGCSAKFNKIGGGGWVSCFNVL